LTAASLARTSALAPSLIDEAFAAVIVPSLPNAGLSDPNFDGSPFEGPSSSFSSFRIALSLRDEHGLDLGIEESFLLRGERATETLFRVVVLRLAREPCTRRRTGLRTSPCGRWRRDPRARRRSSRRRSCRRPSGSRSALSRGSKARWTSTPCRLPRRVSASPSARVLAPKTTA
jgi:hypothetical protein